MQINELGDESDSNVFLVEFRPHQQDLHVLMSRRECLDCMCTRYSLNTQPSSYRSVAYSMSEGVPQMLSGRERPEGRRGAVPNGRTQGHVAGAHAWIEIRVKSQRRGHSQRRAART